MKYIQPTKLRMSNGKLFDYINPKAEDFDIEVIANSLSKICRYLGHCDGFYSVAMHSCLVHDFVEDEFKKEALLHDGVETVTCDCVAGFKALLPDFKKYELKYEKKLAEKFNLVFPFPKEVKIADLTLLATELKYLVNGADYSSIPYKPLNKKIIPWSIEKSRVEFLKRYYKLYGK